MFRANPQPLVYRGLVTGLRISAVDDTAFVDNLPAAIINNYLGGTHQVEVYSSNGAAIVGVFGAKGTGETLSAEKVTNGDFASWTGSVPDGWSVEGVVTATSHISEVSGKARITTDGSYMGLGQSISLSDKALFYNSLTHAHVSGGTLALSVLIPSASNLTYTYSGTGSKSRYATAVSPTAVIIVRAVPSTAMVFDTDDFSLKQVLTPSTSGCTIVSAKGGAVERFKRIDTGFTFNATSYRIIVRKLR